MRVLLRDKRDNTLIVVEATEVNYDPEDSCLCICLVGKDDYAILGIEPDLANTVIRDLYDSGKAALDNYLAEYEPADEDLVSSAE